MSLGNILVAVVLCLGQQSPTFEVASIKRLDPSAPIRARMSTRGGPGTMDPTRFECRGCPLSLLIAKAYDVGALKLRESGPPMDQPETYAPVEKRLDPAGFPILRPGESMAMSLQHYRRHAAETMTDLARFLTLWLGKPVVDRTGLAGRYDTSLTFVMPPQDVPGPTLIDAVRENGLKLTAKKVAVDLIVVESALRSPIEN